MKSSDITKIIKRIAEDPKSTDRVILIDGKWGCGKTYAVNEAIIEFEYDSQGNDGSEGKKCLEEKDKEGSQKDKPSEKVKESKIYYSSLFGAQNIEEVSDAVNNLISPGKKKAKKIVSYGGALIHGMDGLDALGTITDGIAMLIDRSADNLEKIGIKKNITLIFDDVERVGNGFSYFSFLGYLNTLLLYGFKVVCVCCSEEINGNKKGEFENFQEKIFDKVYEINELPNDVILKLFENYKINSSDISLLKDFFNSNIRIAKKTKNFLDDVVKLLKSNGIEYQKKITDYYLLVSCLFTTKIVLEKFDKAKETPTFITMCIDYQSFNAISEPTKTNAINFFENNYNNFPVPSYEVCAFVSSLIQYYLYGSEESLLNYFKMDLVINKNDFYDMQYWSYSDNVKLSKKYLDDIKKGNIKFDSPEEISKLYRFLSGTILAINDKQKEMITKKIAADIPDLNVFYNDYGNDIYNIQSEQEKTFAAQIFTEAKNLFEIESPKNEMKIIKDLLDRNEFYNLNTELRKYFYGENVSTDSKISLLKELIKINYLIPKKLDGELDKYQWACCCYIASLMLQYRDSYSDYKNYLDSLNKKDINATAKRRLDMLYKSIGVNLANLAATKKENKDENNILDENE